MNRYSLGSFICEEPYSNLDSDDECEFSRVFLQTTKQMSKAYNYM
jgi:hypothetical protein